MTSSTPSHTNATSLPRSMPALGWLLIALSVAITVAWFVAARGYWEDDAYIHLEFARSLAAGHGFTFNGHRVYGDTSPLWVWELVAAHWLVPDWLRAGKLLTTVEAAFALSGVYVFAFSLIRYSGDLGRRHFTPASAKLFAATMLLLFTLSPYFGYWAFSGMEALAAVALVCWACAFVAPHHISWWRVLAAALLAGFAPLLRPEMLFFTLLIGCILFLRIRAMHASLLVRTDVFLAALVLIATPAVSWGIYAARTFGSVLPTTNAAKRAAMDDSILSRLLHVYAFGFPVTVLACLLFCAWLLWYFLLGRKPEHPIIHSLHAGGWLLFVWTAINCLFYTANHTLVQTRYIFVTAPVLTVAVFALAALRWPNIYRNLLIVALLYGAVVSGISTRMLVHNKVVIDAAFAQLAATMRALPPSAPVALYAIGEPAFLSEHPIVDTGGITRPGVIPYIHDTDDGRITAWARSEGAQYEVIDHAPLPGAELVWSRDIPATGWYFNPKHYRATERLQLWKLPLVQPRLVEIAPTAP